MRPHPRIPDRRCRDTTEQQRDCGCADMVRRRLRSERIGSPLLVHVRWTVIPRSASGLASRLRDPSDRPPPHAAHADVARSGDRSRRAMRGRRVQEFPRRSNGLSISRTPEPWIRRFSRRSVRWMSGSSAIRVTSSCSITTWALRPSRSDYAPMETPLGPGVTERIAGAAGGRPPPIFPTSTLAWGRPRPDRRHRLAGAVGGRVQPRRGTWPLDPRRPGADALPFASGRDRANAAGGTPVVARRLDPRDRTSGGAG